MADGGILAQAGQLKKTPRNTMVLNLEVIRQEDLSFTCRRANIWVFVDPQGRRILYQHLIPLVLKSKETQCSHVSRDPCVVHHVGSTDHDQVPRSTKKCVAMVSSTKEVKRG